MASGKLRRIGGVGEKQDNSIFLVLTSSDFTNRIEHFLNQAVSSAHHFHP
jgi:hypothetical protein